MLEDKDLQKIRGVICEAIDEIVTPQFDAIHVDISGIKGEMAGIKGEMSGMKGEISGMKQDIAWIKAEMVTKDYLEERLGKFKGELLSVGKWASKQVSRMADILYKNKLLTAEQVIQIRAE